MRVLAIYNPTAGQGRGVQFVHRLAETWRNRATVTLHETECRGSAEGAAAALEPGQYDRIVVAGGDGTINEVINGLRQDVPLGILPIGTANVLARELGLPLNDFGRAAGLVLDGRPTPIDLGEINGRRFLLMAGIGFDAQVVREVFLPLKHLVGAPAYFVSALNQLTHYRAPRFRLEADGYRRNVRAMMVVVANAATYAGALEIAPLATIDDGWLDVCVFREPRPTGFIRQVIAVLRRKHLHDAGVEYFRCRSLRVSCAPPTAIQVDGDLFSETPAEIRVLPGALRVMRPPA